MARSYNSSRRALQAAQTRRDVIDAAVRLFERDGWAGTTVASVAKEAGVAVETVYAGFGSKKNLLLAAADASIVGDADPVPLARRPEYLGLGVGSRPERMRKAGELVADIYERHAGMWRALLEAAASDPEIDEWRRDADSRRRADLRTGLEIVTGKELDDESFDLLWVLLGPDTYLRLVVDRGLSRDEYLDRIDLATAKIAGVRASRGH